MEWHEAPAVGRLVNGAIDRIAREMRGFALPAKEILDFFAFLQSKMQAPDILDVMKELPTAIFLPMFYRSVYLRQQDFSCHRKLTRKERDEAVDI